MQFVEDVSSTDTDSYPGAYDDGYTISPNPHPFSISVGGGTVSATYFVDFRIFPLQYVDYVNPAGKLVRIPGIQAMDLLPGPAAAPHVVKMREDTKSFVDYTLTVYSHDESVETDEEGNSFTTRTDYVTNFTLRVFANYNTNRDKLIAAVNARR